MLHRVRARFPAFAVVAALLLLSGCRELHGPVWSPDGQFIAYTTYSRVPGLGAGHLETCVYLVDPDDDSSEAHLLARDAGFPHWVSDGPTLYYLAKRDKQGFYHAISMHRPGGRRPGEGMHESVLEVPGLRLVDFQLSADGSRGLLGSAQEARPGMPQTIEFWNARDKQRTPMPQLGEIYAPALAPNGRILAYAKRPPNEKPYVVILELDRPKLEEKAVFPTPEQDEPSASSYVIYPFPDNDRFLFYAPGGRRVWVVRRDGRGLKSYTLPPEQSSPLMVRLSEDSKHATLTLASPAEGRLCYSVYNLEFERGVFKRLDGDAPELLGGHVLDPRSIRLGATERWAWLSSAGLAMGVPGKARYYPQTSEQHIAASGLYLQQGESAKALSAALKAREVKPPPEDPGALDRAEAHAYLKANEGVRASESFQRSVLLFPIGPSGLRFIFPATLGVLQQTGPDPSVAVREMDAFTAAAPEDRLLAHLREALLARAKGDSASALRAYREAERLSPSVELTGGLKFQQALAAFEGGDVVAAGEHWESAARCNGFPQAEYAAGLSAIAFALDGRPASDERANASLQLGLSFKTALAEELQKLPSELRGKRFRQVRSSDQVRSADRSMGVWVEVTEYVIPQAFLRPTRVCGLDRNYAERRISAMYATLSALQIAGLPEGTQKLLQIPRPISQPQFSPSGEAIAFLAQGAVFPLPDAYCEAYVVDLRGVILAGDPLALRSGRLSGRAVLSAFSWASPQELRISGTQVDVFGGETPMQKAVTLPSR